jgi:hypothetical protein
MVVPAYASQDSLMVRAARMGDSGFDSRQRTIRQIAGYERGTGEDLRVDCCY